MDYSRPVPGKLMFEALKNERCIVMACNIRIGHSVRGIMMAAKEIDAAVLFEIAKSEIKYTGQNPRTFVDNILKIAKELKFSQPYVIHGDHIGVKSPDPKDVESAATLIRDEIAAGFTSFAIDASHNFNAAAPTVREQLKDNIEITTKLCGLIPKDASLEVEVGEVGKTDPTTGEKAITTVEEAVTYIKAINENGYKPDLLATNNGTSHGNIFDKNGKPIPKSINVERTGEIAKAIKPYGVRIAQHGITGTPLEYMPRLIEAGIAKGNVGTNWQNIAVAAMPKDLAKRMEDWTLSCEESAKMRAKKPGCKDSELIGKNIKNAIVVFKSEIDAIKGDDLRRIDEATKKGALEFFGAFNAKGTASKVRAHIESKGL
ncbi:MAG: class II fructose-bisphosphate aldolase [Candidatus Altiarchaeota archaeon]